MLSFFFTLFFFFSNKNNDTITVVLAQGADPTRRYAKHSACNSSLNIHRRPWPQLMSCYPFYRRGKDRDEGSGKPFPACSLRICSVSGAVLGIHSWARDFLCPEPTYSLVERKTPKQRWRRFAGSCTWWPRSIMWKGSEPELGLVLIWLLRRSCFELTFRHFRQVFCSFFFGS